MSVCVCVCVSHNRVSDNWNVVLLVLMQSIDELLEFGLWEMNGICGEDAICIHIVDISPHGVKRQIMSSVFRDNFSKISDIVITPTALVKTYRIKQTIIGHQTSLSSRFMNDWNKGSIICICIVMSLPYQDAKLEVRMVDR